ncbi:protein AAR2 homolog [Anthonomus grandis grandis]|uniref:protein AAR2 homolog n=1 Tax=Anthonomus grandis grandis TaxID=2921223 RepID=UPI0021658214|nr:protein AAR2 homolog [Anthonomus grandis grandis]XP_050308402.1 protein AAR2 homolog [Anthonomus grandis grandis]XP_050308403.1 protein AAR2 homolog [Anthonomus grandis grandis]XP_050308404.1 protein AAR2 homolog [Anthonomus grandis grandis]XP_050308405.1 protein AAR2 homolog [Anthonomus grandis grandis]
MDQEKAKTLFSEGAFFVFLNVPEGTEFGIDMKSWNTGEKFRGVKMIPSGLHYIFYSSVSNTGDTAPRRGFFHYFKKGEFLVRKWNKVDESISLEPVQEAEVVGLKENILALDKFLGPYPFDIWEKWKALTQDITEILVQKIMPLNGVVSSALELEPCTDANRPRGIKNSETEDDLPTSSKKARSSMTESELLPHLKPKAGTELRFSDFPKHAYPEGSTPAQITRHSLDSSYLFNQILGSYNEPIEILGELEFCYICFLVGHSLEAFEQWKRIFILFCSCEEAITKHRMLYDKFLSIVELQVEETPEEFLADIVANNNFVYLKLKDLFRSIRSSNVDGKLKCKADRLKSKLTSLYQWDFSHLESEDEDDAPVVVELEN